jgi:hypothetical protein
MPQGSLFTIESAPCFLTARANGSFGTRLFSGFRGQCCPELTADEEEDFRSTFFQEDPPLSHLSSEGDRMASKRLSIQQRKEIFQDLVETQDSLNPLSVRKSYEIVTEKHEITDAQLRQIENEGIEKQWPPLNETLPTVA